jgi:hypothetical protein
MKGATAAQTGAEMMRAIPDLVLMSELSEDEVSPPARQDTFLLTNAKQKMFKVSERTGSLGSAWI